MSVWEFFKDVGFDVRRQAQPCPEPQAQKVVEAARDSY